MPEGSLKLKAQIMCGGETAMGPGKADLLGAIDREGSISAAGRALGMSYRRCWQLVDTMNRCWAERVVETAIGGGRERGARLTPLGQQLLTAYRGLEATLASAAERDLGWFTTALRAEPIPASGHRVLNK